MISLFAGEERAAKRESLKDLLLMLARRIDFLGIAAAVDRKLPVGGSGKGGRSTYPTEVMVKLLAQQRLYNLSDDALEYQVLDRLSFLRFLALEHSPRMPDAKTIWVWRERLKTYDPIGRAVRRWAVSWAASDSLRVPARSSTRAS